MKLSRRIRWAVACGLGLVVAAFAVVSAQRQFTVVVYNNGNEPFHQVCVSVGGVTRMKDSLEGRESIALPFKRAEHSTDVNLYIDSDPPIHWSAPSLATPRVSSITLRVDESGAVTHTVENRWELGD